MPAPIVNGRKDSFWKWQDFQLWRAHDRVILHTAVHHSSTSTNILNFIKIKETSRGRTDGRMDARTNKHLRPALLGWFCRQSRRRKRHLDRYSCFIRITRWQTDWQTNRPRYSVGNNRRSTQWRSQILLLSTATTSYNKYLLEQWLCTNAWMSWCQRILLMTAHRSWHRRSADTQKLVAQRTRTILSARESAVSSAVVWNSLPEDLRESAVSSAGVWNSLPEDLRESAVSSAVVWNSLSYGILCQKTSELHRNVCQALRHTCLVACSNWRLFTLRRTNVLTVITIMFQVSLKSIQGFWATGSWNLAIPISFAEVAQRVERWTCD